MLLLPVKTPIIKEGDDIAAIISDTLELHDGDILAISSKAVAITEGTHIDLSHISPSEEAHEWAKRCGRSPAFRQAILDEASRMHGKVIGSCPQAMLTELKPDGFTEGTLIAVNAGLDQSNIKDGHAIGWPLDPVSSANQIKSSLGGKLGVLLTDSCCRPGRLGLTAIALTVSGFDPLISQIDTPDLFGTPLKMTHEATADQLATAANFLMGNADESTPAVVIRDHGLPLTDFHGWVPGIARKDDLFAGLL